MPQLSNVVGMTDYASFDVLGRRFVIGAKLKFRTTAREGGRQAMPAPFGLRRVAIALMRILVCRTWADIKAAA